MKLSSEPSILKHVGGGAGGRNSDLTNSFDIQRVTWTAFKILLSMFMTDSTMLRHDIFLKHFAVRIHSRYVKPPVFFLLKTIYAI